MTGDHHHTITDGAFFNCPDFAQGGLNHYFLVVWPHHDDLAAQVIRQRMRKIVYSVSFVPQIG